MIDLSELFPKPISHPFTVWDAFENVGNDGIDTAFEWASNPKWIVSTYIPLIKPGKSCDEVHPKKAGFNLVRLRYDRCSPTIPKTCNGSLFAGLLHPEQNRYCSISEIKRLGSFPDKFQMPGLFGEQWARVGNSVPPLFMAAIASSIREKIFGYRMETYQHSSNKYLDILDDAWQKHLAPRQANAPTVISTFAGCGGSSLGYSIAGFRELLAVEWDDNAVETFKLNFPDVPVYHGDIAKLSVEQVLATTGLKPGELDVFDGSPPCQGFSTAGKRIIDDPRNQLFREYVRLLQGLQPKVFVMENVSGMVKGKMKLVFVEILKELKASGYRVKACLLNAKFFNVPQSRERMIFIGVRDDLDIEPSHPKAQGQPIAIKDAIIIPDGTIGYVTASNERHTLAGRVPLRNLNQPMATIVKTGNSRMMVDKKIVPINAYECARFGGFPDQYQWISKVNERIGNSVPPLFMAAIAGHIRREILDT